MSKFSDYYEDKIVDHMLRGVAFTVPTIVYCALFTANTNLESNAPTDEVSGGSYARQTITFNASSGGATDNSATLTFPTATANWGVVTATAVVDNVSLLGWGTNVNVCMWGDLDASKNVQSGDAFQITAGELDVTVA